tara:strand:- start:17 stop:1387 length:1371 start_codon:yes stop_codon:yes gene_type:complete
MATRKKPVFVCNDCGAGCTKWQGQCSECKAWNTLVEMRLGNRARAAKSSRSGYSGHVESEIKTLSEIKLDDVPRVSSGSDELNLVLGGGLVQGSCVLLGGEPGAGKSTLLLQVLSHLASMNPALYVSGEESSQQIAMRASRLELPMSQLKIVSETSAENLCAIIETHKPAILIVDSIQVMHVDDIDSAPGSVAQVRESAAMLVRLAKQTGMILIIIGHVTKDGTLAGPKVLEHMIDCSLMLEVSTDSHFRMIRSHKNRFGAVNELGVFAMTDRGLKEVSNPSAIFLQRDSDVSPGSAVTSTWEGSRPLLVELQALVSDSPLGNPRRVTVGLDQNRLSMLLAVLQRHGGIMVGDQDVYVNVVGGIKILETSADLALILCVLSSLRNLPLPRDLLVLGEVGLAGEIRPVVNGQERMREAEKHGFRSAIVPIANNPKKKMNKMRVIPVKKLADAMDVFF